MELWLLASRWSKLAELYTKSSEFQCRYISLESTKKWDDITRLLRSFQFMCSCLTIALKASCSGPSRLFAVFFSNTLLWTHSAPGSLFFWLFLQISASFFLKTFAHAVPLLKCSSLEIHAFILLFSITSLLKHHLLREDFPGHCIYNNTFSLS